MFCQDNLFKVSSFFSSVKTGEKSFGRRQKKKKKKFCQDFCRYLIRVGPE